MTRISNYLFLCTEKLASAKIEHKEVAQSIASQKAKLTEVLNQINYHLQVSVRVFPDIFSKCTHAHFYSYKLLYDFLMPDCLQC